MNQFEQEIKRRIKHYYDQLAALENAYYNHEIESKEYIVEYEKVKQKIEAAMKRIAELKLLIKLWKESNV